jgi:hypothetical protein
MIKILNGFTIGILFSCAVIFYAPTNVVYQCTDEQVRKESLSRLRIAIEGGHADYKLPKRKI